MKLILKSLFYIFFVGIIFTVSASHIINVRDEKFHTIPEEVQTEVNKIIETWDLTQEGWKKSESTPIETEIIFRSTKAKNNIYRNYYLLKLIGEKTTDTSCNYCFLCKNTEKNQYILLYIDGSSEEIISSSIINS